jgi:hypothetical protein
MKFPANATAVTQSLNASVPAGPITAVPAKFGHDRAAHPPRQDIFTRDGSTEVAPPRARRDPVSMAHAGLATRSICAEVF